MFILNYYLYDKFTSMEYKYIATIHTIYVRTFLLSIVPREQQTHVVIFFGKILLHGNNKKTSWGL